MLLAATDVLVVFASVVALVALSSNDVPVVFVLSIVLV